jgi:dolichol-phosphate mannosyltransferase
LKKLDIIIPVYDEGESIIDVLETLRKQVQTPFRVLICYNYAFPYGIDAPLP